MRSTSASIDDHRPGYQPSLAREATRSLTRLKWVGTIAPAVFLALVLQLLQGPFHEELHHFPGFVYVVAILSICVLGFSFLVFGIIERLERSLVDQNRELSALVAVGSALTSSLVPRDQLAEALDVIVSVTSADLAEVWLAGQDGSVTLEQQHGAIETPTPVGTILPAGTGLPGVAVASCEHVIVDDLASDPRCVRPELVDSGYRSAYVLPLRQGDRAVGALVVAARAVGSLNTPTELRLLEGIGNQLTVAIENATLHDRVLDRAVVEERERLARELHDELAQLLGYVNTQTLVIKRLLSSGREDEARLQVASMEANAQRVYVDVREAILGLRTGREGLLPSLRSYLDQFALSAGVRTSLEVSESADVVSLPDSVELQLIRIVQEALTNVRKHAGASTATVSVSIADDDLVVTIADDGRGFDRTRPRQTGWPHFGLQTMEERAYAVGATLTVESEPGAGTTVTIVLPGVGAHLGRTAALA